MSVWTVRVTDLAVLIFWLALAIFIGSFFSRVRVAFGKRGFLFRRARYGSLGVVLGAALVIGLLNPAEPQPKSSAPAASPAERASTSGAAQTMALSQTERDAGIAAICITANQYESSSDPGKDPLIIAVDRARGFDPTDPRMGGVVGHLLVYLYRRGPSEARLKELNQIARGFNNPRGITPLTEGSWTENDCAEAEATVGAPVQTTPDGAIGRVFASETR